MRYRWGTVLLVLALAAPAAAADGGRTIAVNTQFDDPGFVPGFHGFGCDVKQPWLCEGQFTGNSVVHGTMEGTDTYEVYGHVNFADGSEGFTADETFHGTFAGCGTGTFDFVVEGTVSGLPGSQKLDGIWKLVPGSGTGDLTRLQSGNGRETGTVDPNTHNSGSFTGTAVCGDPED